MTSGPPLMQIREKRNWDARVSTRQRIGAQFASEQFANEWFILVGDRLGRGKSVTEAQGEAFQSVATDADPDDSQMELTVWFPRGFAGGAGRGRRSASRIRLSTEHRFQWRANR